MGRHLVEIQNIKATRLRRWTKWSPTPPQLRPPAEPVAFIGMVRR